MKISIQDSWTVTNTSKIKKEAVLTLTSKNAQSCQNWQKMTPRWDKVEDGEMMAPEATVEASAEADTVVAEAVATEVAAVEATVTIVAETEVDVDTAEVVEVDIKAVVVDVVVVVVTVVVVTVVVIAGEMMEGIVQAGEVEEIAVAWIAIVAVESFTTHNPSTKVCVEASVKPIQPSPLHSTSRKQNHMGQDRNSTHQIQALLSTKLVIRATAVTIALFTLAT